MKVKILILFLSMARVSISQKRAQMKSAVNINMDERVGIIRPLHGGNDGPVSALKVLNFSDFYKACKIPITRLHDVVWFNTYAVDITTIFRDFNQDPSKKENYDFRQTDDYIASIIKTGTKILYRLGESIEWTKQKYNVNPPADNEKWAAICCAIIRHYNDGWDNGFHYNIRYWEIWNEPDIDGPSDAPRSWTGTPEQFFHLFEIAAKTIKRNFPGIKVGGPAIASAVNVKNGTTVASDFANKFLSYCQTNSVPLDFFSWHNYNKDPWQLAHLPTYVHSILNQYGFSKTESILDEWNYIPGGKWNGYLQGAPRVKWYSEQSSVKGGAFVADVLMLLQDEPIDVANLYTTTNGAFGLFSDMGEMHKSAYAFQAFAELVDNTPLRLETQYSKADSLVICTGTNKEKTELAILISNFSSEGKKIDLKLINNFLEGPIKYEVYAVDEEHNLSKIKGYKIENKSTLEINQDIKGPSVYLLKLASVKYDSSK